MSQTYDRVVNILDEQVGAHATGFTPETTLEAAGLDSLDLVEVVMACEEEFGIEIDQDSHPATIGEFAAQIDQILG